MLLNMVMEILKQKGHKSGMHGDMVMCTVLCGGNVSMYVWVWKMRNPSKTFRNKIKPES